MNLISHTLQGEQPVETLIDERIRDDRAALRAFDLGEFFIESSGVKLFLDCSHFCPSDRKIPVSDNG